MRMLAGIAAAAILVGCAELPRTTSSGPEIRAETDSAKTTLAGAVARARTSLDNVDGHTLWRGVYGGESAHGCSRVRLNIVEKPAHQWHYLVCGVDVREIRDVAPEPPRDKRLIVVLNGLTQAAWRTGRVQRMPYDGYELEAEAVGPSSFGGCRLVEQRLVYQDMLVDVREERVCGLSQPIRSGETSLETSVLQSLSSFARKEHVRRFNVH